MAAPILPLLPVSAAVKPALLYSQALNRMLRGTSDGLILESRDSSATWQTVANFGAHCSIQALLEQQGKLYARVGVQANSFLLESTDARVWRTTAQLSLI